MAATLVCRGEAADCGFDGLAVLVQQHLGQDPFSGQLFAFRGKRGDLVKILSWDGQGLCLYAKRMEKGRFVWPQAKDGAVSLTPAQLSIIGRYQLADADTNLASRAGGLRLAQL